MSRSRRSAPRGRLISFEGVEGAGKSTQLALLEEDLRGRGTDVVVTREPGGTDLGERIRSILLEPGAAPINARAELLLFAAARAQLVEDVIRPALARGAVVLSDRFVDSSLAYQGAGRRLGEEDVGAVSHFATGGLMPDATVLLRVDPFTAAHRRTTGPDRIEAEPPAFHRRVAAAFLELALAQPERFVVVDGVGPPERVFGRIRTGLAPFLDGKPA